MASSILDPNETFASLTESVGLDYRLRKAVQRLGHVRPTLVQSKCLPLAITSGRDLLVRAKTGSGKTLAYCLPLLQKILRSSEVSGTNHAPGVRAVILVPTRELCSQVFRTLQSLVYYCDEVVSLAVLSATRKGGRGTKAQQDIARQKAMLRDRPDVIVATPAGLLTHIRNGDVELKDTMETLVVDEADLVLSFGYTDDVSEIIKSLPRISQGFLMSATLSPELNSLKKVVLHSPVVLKLENEEANKGKGIGHLTQFHLELPRKDKNLVIYVFLKLGLLKGKGIFFVNSTDGGYRLKLFLEQFHIRSSVLNAELPFRSRLNIIEQFNVGNFDYLIATDESTDAADNDGEDSESDDENDTIDDDDDDDDEPQQSKKGKKKDDEYGVSRGLDFRDVSFVLNVDFPPSSKSYAHRVGRTARGGAKGVALSLVEKDSYEQHDVLQAIQDDQPKISSIGAATETFQSTAGSTDPTPGSSSFEQSQPSPLDFDLREIEGFRYRVEDVSRAVTKMAIKEARAAELRAEILNSDRLQGHFEDNPTDLQLLRHDRLATHVSKVQDHLKHIPKYLLPRGMQVANLNRKRKRRKAKGKGNQRRSAKDPLQSFSDGDVNLDGLEGGDDDYDMVDFGEGIEGDGKKQKRGETEKKTLLNTRDGTGKSTAGRNSWKEKHRKGKFSKKTRLSDRKTKDPLGI